MTVLVFWLLPLLAQADVDGLVAQLGDDSVIEREKAQKALVALGRPALPKLRAHLEQSRDEEVRARLQAIIRHLTQIRWQRNLVDALAAAKKEGKPLLIFSTIGEPDGYA